jgi:hypothetical protein
MKKNNKVIYLIFIIGLIYGCAGYKPIFSSSSLNFKIEEYKIEGDKMTANKIYSSLKRSENYELTENELLATNFFISTSKTKIETIKDKTGKVKEYKIIIKAKVEITKYLSDDILLNEIFEASSNYKVQDNYSETVLLENRSIENLTETISQNILNKIAVKISSQ